MIYFYCRLKFNKNQCCKWTDYIMSSTFFFFSYDFINYIMQCHFRTLKRELR